MNKSSAQGSEDPILQWVTFRLDNETYGINVRGNVVTVIDPRQRFGLDSTTVTDNTRIVIIEADKQVVGILVDSVAEVVYLRQSEVETAPNVGNDESAKFIQGVCNKN